MKILGHLFRSPPPPEARSEAPAKGGCATNAAPAPVRGTAAADRARVARHAESKVSPLVADFVAKHALEPRIAAVRAGQPGLLADEKSTLLGQLSNLDAAQRKALREVLLERPPHPALKQIREHPAVKGPPTLAALMSIFAGEPFGLAPRPSVLLQERARQGLAWLPPCTPEVRAQWLNFLSSSDIAVGYVERKGGSALEALRALGLSAVELACGSDWGRQSVLIEVAENAPEGWAGAAAFVRAHGAEALGDALGALENLRWHSRFSAASTAKSLGFEGAVQLARALDDKEVQHGLRALATLQGKENPGELLPALAGKSAAQIRALAADAARRIPAFGDGNAPLYGGYTWPHGQVRPLDRLRASLPSANLSAIAWQMREEIVRVNPRLAADLDRELLGRRFVSFRYYDELYQQGIANPEHRYSVQTFESWKRAAEVAAERAAASRGRPLQKGELIALMRELHALVGRGMLDVHETHMKESDLGRIRSEARDHVQLGDGVQRVGKKTAELLAVNPYLQHYAPLETAGADEDGMYTRLISFAEGPRVPKLVEELEGFVRAQEGRIPPEQLAAEVHFRLVSIHPFMDANGRTSKLIADFLLARAGIRAPIWREGDVMKNRERWPSVLREGIEYDLQTVERYFDTAMGGRA